MILLQVAREVQALKAQWAAEDEAARQGEVEARLGQQRLNAEVKEFNRWAESRRLQHPASCCGRCTAGWPALLGLSAEGRSRKTPTWASSTCMQRSSRPCLPAAPTIMKHAWQLSNLGA